MIDPLELGYLVVVGQMPRLRATLGRALPVSRPL